MNNSNTLQSEIDFYFDFASPYAYFLADQLASIAKKYGSKLHWHPMLLWVVIKAQNMPPPMDFPAKDDYMRRDMDRSAAFYQLPFQLPESFPQSSHLPARLFYQLNRDSEKLAADFAMKVFEKFFVEGLSLKEPENILQIAEQLGIDKQTANAQMTSDEAKSMLAAANEKAIQAGVWGSPFVCIDDEKFFGVDRLPQIAKYLAER